MLGHLPARAVGGGASRTSGAASTDRSAAVLYVYAVPTLWRRDIRIDRVTPHFEIWRADICTTANSTKVIFEVFIRVVEYAERYEYLSWWQRKEFKGASHTSGLPESF